MLLFNDGDALHAIQTLTQADTQTHIEQLPDVFSSLLSPAGLSVQTAGVTQQPYERSEVRFPAKGNHGDSIWRVAARVEFCCPFNLSTISTTHTHTHTYTTHIHTDLFFFTHIILAKF